MFVPIYASGLGLNVGALFHEVWIICFPKAMICFMYQFRLAMINPIYIDMINDRMVSGMSMQMYRESENPSFSCISF